MITAPESENNKDTKPTLESTLARAHTLESSGHIAKAVALGLSMLANHSTSFELLVFLARLYQRDDYYDQAVLYLKRALSQDPFHEILWYELGVGYQRLTLFVEAETACQEGLAHYPNAYGLLMMSGQLLQRRGCFAKAQLIFEDAFERFPKDALVLMHLGMVCLRQDAVDEAIAYLEMSCLYNNKNSAAYGNLGNAFLRKGAWEKAKEAYQHVVTLDPDNLACHTSLGILSLKQGELKDAQNQFQLCLRKSQKDMRAFAYLNYTQARLSSAAELGLRHNLGRFFKREQLLDNLQSPPLSQTSSQISSHNTLQAALSTLVTKSDHLRYEPSGQAVKGGYQTSFFHGHEPCIEQLNIIIKPLIDRYFEQMKIDRDHSIFSQIPSAYRIDYFGLLYCNESYETRHLARGYISGIICLQQDRAAIDRRGGNGREQAQETPSLSLEGCLEPHDFPALSEKGMRPFSFSLACGDMFLFPSFLFCRTLVRSGFLQVVVLKFHISPTAWRY